MVPLQRRAPQVRYAAARDLEALELRRRLAEWQAVAQAKAKSLRALLATALAAALSWVRACAVRLGAAARSCSSQLGDVASTLASDIARGVNKLVFPNIDGGASPGGSGVPKAWAREGPRRWERAQRKPRIA